jgi:hypothetical protein
MPLPFVLGALLAREEFLADALSRQPEVHRLKEQVKRLHREIERLQLIIFEQDRQIYELKIRYNTLKAYQFIEKAKQKSKIKGAIMFQYGFKEYIELLVAKAHNPNFVLKKEEQAFFNIFERLINNANISLEEKMFVREYIRFKYKNQIESLIEVDIDMLVKKVEKVNVA